LNNLIHINNLSEKNIFESLLSQVEELFDINEPIVSNLSNFTALINQSFDKINWVGFYFRKENDLYLGPFQGKVACTKILIGKGVCGKCAETLNTIIVEDVNKFPDHIFCDKNSKSEIVIPVISNNELFGVLDIDSYNYSSFNETDQFYFEKIIEILTHKLKLENFAVK